MENTMNNNNNKLFGGMGPEKAGELGGNAPHKCRGQECNEKSHAKDTHSKDSHHDKATATHKADLNHAKNADHSKSKQAHQTDKGTHKAATGHKKD